MKRICTKKQLTGEYRSFNLFRQGFTLGELTITLIIITMVVVVTLPITYNKMKKVDSNQYYMGYDTALDIWANLSPDLIPDPVEEEDPETPETPEEPEEPETPSQPPTSTVKYGDCYLYNCEYGNSPNSPGASMCRENTIHNVSEDECWDMIWEERNNIAQTGGGGGQFKPYK